MKVTKSAMPYISQLHWRTTEWNAVQRDLLSKCIFVVFEVVLSGMG